MARLTFASLSFAASVLFGAGSALASNCSWDQWESHGRCYDKKGSCSQYNYSDSDTCNSPRDELKCDFNHDTRVCYPEGGYDGSGINPGGGGSGGHHSDREWYSHKYSTWYPKQGYCGQYSHTDYDTCNSGQDWMQCDYDSHSGSCYDSSNKHNGHS